jgi:integrase
MARHGLRVTEAVDLRWDQVDFAKGHLHVRRLKNGIDSVHTVQGDELRALRELRRGQKPQSAFLFTSERGGPMTRSNVAKMIEATADRAGLPHMHPHGTLAGISWLTPAMTPGGYNFGWAIPTSSTPPLTRN